MLHMLLQQNVMQSDGSYSQQYDMFQLCLDTHYWTAVNQFFVWGSLAAYFAISFTMYSNGMFLIFTSSFPFIGE